MSLNPKRATEAPDDPDDPGGEAAAEYRESNEADSSADGSTVAHGSWLPEALPLPPLEELTLSDELPPLEELPLLDEGALDDSELRDEPLEDALDELELPLEDALDELELPLEDALDELELPQSQLKTCRILQKGSPEESCGSSIASIIEPTGSAKSMPRCFTRLKTLTLFDTSNSSTGSAPSIS